MDLDALPVDLAHPEGRPHLAEHFDAMREFYREAARRGQCVVVWVD